LPSSKYKMGRISKISLAAVAFLAIFAAIDFTQRSNARTYGLRSFFACSPIPILIGSLVNGSLADGDCIDTNTALFDGYTFNGVPGELIDVTLTGDGFVPSLRLVQGSYPGGNIIATGTDPGNGTRRISGFTVPSAGTFTIVASSASAGITGGYTLTFESTNPRVDLIQRTSPNPTVAGSTVGFSVFFTSSVTGVDAGDFALTTTGVAGAAITNVVGTGNFFTVSVNTGSGAGTVRLDVTDNDTILSSSGVPLGGAGLGNGNFISGPTYTITDQPTGTPTPTPTPSLNMVITNTNDSGAGSLRQAIADVIPGGTITFSSFFTSPQTITLTSGELRVLKDLTINGPGPELLTVSGANAGRVFNIGQSSPGFTISISGLKIANGRAPDNDFGGGIEQNFGTLTITNCIFSDNSAPPESTGVGGAIDFFDGTINIIDSSFSGNTSALSGAGVAFSNATFTVSNSTFAGNASASGGGLHIFGGSGTINGSTFTANTASNRGGAILAQNCGFSIVNSTISGNSADTAIGIAGGIAFESTSGARTAEITSSTIANNTATPNEVGGILVIARQRATASASLSIRNSIIAANSEPSLLALASNGATAGIVSQGFNQSNGSGNGFLTQTTDRTNSEPGLGPLADNGGRTFTHRLLATSVAIDAGNSFGLVSDQRGNGFARRVDLTTSNPSGGDGTDIGSFELQSEPPLTTASISGRVTTPSGLGLRNAVVALTDLQGARRTATTSSFGIYAFSNIPTGINYVVSVSSKRYRFAPQNIAVSGNLANVDFTGLE
jgi:predicted outer membrane repeat protein